MPLTKEGKREYWKTSEPSSLIRLTVEDLVDGKQISLGKPVVKVCAKPTTTRVTTVLTTTTKAPEITKTETKKITTTTSAAGTTKEEEKTVTTTKAPTTVKKGTVTVTLSCSLGLVFDIHLRNVVAFNTIFHDMLT